jgi:hypothetical protein
MEKLYKKTVELAQGVGRARGRKNGGIDAALREIWKDELQPFYERYPYVKKIDYSKSIKGGTKG